MQGKALTWSMTSILQQFQVLPADASPSVNLVKSLSRLDSVFVHFTDGRYTAKVSDFASMAAVIGQDRNISAWDQGWSYWMSVDSKNYPEVPVSGYAEAYSLLRQAVHTSDSEVRNISIKYDNYFHDSFIIGLSTEKQPGTGFSGVSTKTGSLTRINFRNIDPVIKNCWVTVLFTQIIELRDSGCSVFD